MAQESESRSLDKVIVRLPDGMRERIKAMAERNGRSMNAEIVQALEAAFPPENPSTYQLFVHWAARIAREPDAAKREAMLEEANQQVAATIKPDAQWDRSVVFSEAEPKKLRLSMAKKRKTAE